MNQILLGIIIGIIRLITTLVIIERLCRYAAKYEDNLS
jgi:hypothetical protein